MVLRCEVAGPDGAIPIAEAVGREAAGRGFYPENSRDLGVHREIRVADPRGRLITA